MQAFILITMPTYQFSCEVLPRYLPEQSEPENQLFAFSYTVTITNTGEVAAQLIARHWFISDANGLSIVPTCSSEPSGATNSSFASRRAPTHSPKAKERKAHKRIGLQKTQPGRGQASLAPPATSSPASGR